MSYKWLKTCATLLALGSISAPAFADDEAMERYKDWLPEDIISMPAETRQSEVPIVYIMAANTVKSPLGELTLQSYLNTLMYDGIGDLEGAKKQFQADLGSPPTGNLTVGQIASLSYRSERTRLTNVNFFSFQHAGHISGDWASVKGTAVILDDKIAYPINFVEIECRKNDGLCDYRQLVLTLPDESSFAQSYSVMEMVNETYKITRWDQNRIDAIPLREGECRINELRLNFGTKEYYEFATNAPEANCEMLLGGTLPKLEKPRVVQIVDGDPIVREQFRKIREEAYEFLSSEFRARVAASSPPEGE